MGFLIIWAFVEVKGFTNIWLNKKTKSKRNVLMSNH
jgi:hypothetical protein